jgi:hypothetical protein
MMMNAQVYPNKPAASKFLKPEDPPILPPPGLDLQLIADQAFAKQKLYLSDPTIIKPLEYTPDEKKVLNYICETSEFRPLDHIGYPGYALSMDARLKTIESGYITKGYKRSSGYSVFTVRVNGQQVQIQRNVMMAKAYIGNPPTAEHTTVDHMDIDCTNDYLYNLRWATPTQQAYNRQKSLKPKKGKCVTQVDPSTGIEMFTWFSRKAARIEYRLPKKGSMISTAITKGRLCAGFLWKNSFDLLVENGVLEEWKLLKTAKFSIWVSCFGRVYNECSGMWYGATAADGRKQIGLRDINGDILNRSVHRLIALAFMGEPPSPKMKAIDHIDGNPRNNRVSNLRYITATDNMINSYATGNHSAPKENARRKPIVQLTLKDEFVEEWECIGDAEAKLGFKKSWIHAALKKSRLTCKGYKWVYSTEYFA